MGTEERRRHRRYEVAGLQGSLIHALDARVLNISLAGLAVETMSQITVGHELAVRLAQADNELNMAATVRWCHLAGTDKDAGGEVRPLYHAGLAFENVLGGLGVEVLGFLERSRAVDVHARLFGRFDLLSEQAVTLEADHHFAVKKISLSGMLIETSMAAKPEEVLDLDLDLAGEPFRVKARVVSVISTAVDDHRLHYEMGVELVELSESLEAQLRSFIRRELDEDVDGE